MGLFQSKKIKHYLFADIPTRDYLEQQLITACFDLDTKKAFQALELGVSVNSAITTQRRERVYPLHAIFYECPYKAHTRKPRMELLQVLLDFGADVNVVDQRGETAIHKLCSWSLCTKSGEGPETLNLLLQHGAHPDVKDIKGNTPLHYCCKEVEKGILSILTADERVDVTAQNDEGKTCLHFAAAVGNSLLTKKLIMHGCDVNKQCHNGNTPLHEVFKKSTQTNVHLPGRKMY